MFVCAIEADHRKVVLGTSDELLVRALTVSRPYIATGEPLGRRLLVQVRYQHQGAWAHPQVTSSGKLHIVFEQPVRAAAPGQVAVVYDDDEVVAGGIISSIHRDPS